MKRERRLIQEYIKSGDIEGAWAREVPVHVVARDTSLKHKDFEAYTDNLAELSNSLRIDAVCTTKRHIYLVEAKQQLNPSALGQLLVYKELYEKGHDHVIGKRQVHMIALVEKDNPMIRPIFEAHGIEIVVFSLA